MSLESPSPQSGASFAPEFLVETSDHADQVEALFDRAFGPGRHAKTADRLRQNNQLLHDLSRVAIADGGVVGAVRVWPVHIGACKSCIFIGPVAVDTDYRGGSLGLKLTQACLDAAGKAGVAAAVLIGDAPYFSRIGFEVVSSEKITPPGYVPPGRLLLKKLNDHLTLKEFAGRINVPLATMPTWPEEQK